MGCIGVISFRFMSSLPSSNMNGLIKTAYDYAELTYYDHTAGSGSERGALTDSYFINNTELVLTGWYISE